MSKAGCLSLAAIAMLVTVIAAVLVMRVIAFDNAITIIYNVPDGYRGPIAITFASGSTQAPIHDRTLTIDIPKGGRTTLPWSLPKGWTRYEVTTHSGTSIPVVSDVADIHADQVGAFPVDVEVPPDAIDGQSTGQLPSTQWLFIGTIAEYRAFGALPVSSRNPGSVPILPPEN